MGRGTVRGRIHVFESLHKTYSVYMKVVMIRAIFGQSCGGVQYRGKVNVFDSLHKTYVVHINVLMFGVIFGQSWGWCSPGDRKKK